MVFCVVNRIMHNKFSHNAWHWRLQILYDCVVERASFHSLITHISYRLLVSDIRRQIAFMCSGRWSQMSSDSANSHKQQIFPIRNTAVHKIPPFHRRIAPHKLVETPDSVNRIGKHLPLRTSRFLCSMQIVFGLTSLACPTPWLTSWNVLHGNELYYYFIVRWICRNCQNNRASIWMQPTGSQPTNETTTNRR